MGVWTVAAAAEVLGEDAVIGVSVAGRKLALYRIADALFATDDICTHAYAHLSDGYCDDEAGTIECPLHAARFDIRTGEVLEGPAFEPIRTYPIRLEDGNLLVELD